MGRNKDVRLSFRPNAKNQVYLRALGYIDGRTGKVRQTINRDGKLESVMNFNAFVNKCVSFVCESKKLDLQVSTDDLIEAWISFQIRENFADIKKLAEENKLLEARRVDVLNGKYER